MPGSFRQRHLKWKSTPWIMVEIAIVAVILCAASYYVGHIPLGRTLMPVITVLGIILTAIVTNNNANKQIEASQQSTKDQIEASQQVAAKKASQDCTPALHGRAGVALSHINSAIQVVKVAAISELVGIINDWADLIAEENSNPILQDSDPAQDKFFKDLRDRESKQRRQELFNTIRQISLDEKDSYKNHLSRINLSNMNLRDADLQEANLQEANLTGARWNAPDKSTSARGTIWPVEFSPADHSELNEVTWNKDEEKWVPVP